MGYSLKLLVSVTVFTLALTVIFGLIGQDQLQNIDYTSSLSEINFSSGDDIGVTEAPSFFRGLAFTVDGLPTWLAFSLGFLIPFLIVVGVVGFIRGL